MAKDLTIEKNDIVLIAAGLIGVLIILLSLWALFWSPLRTSPFDKEKATAFKDLFDVVVKGTLLPLFSALVTFKITFAVAKVVLNKISDK